MEFVDGETLQQRLTRGAIPIDETLQIARQVAGSKPRTIATLSIVI
jgi:hypothetical protein